MKRKKSFSGLHQLMVSMWVKDVTSLFLVLSLSVLSFMGCEPAPGGRASQTAAPSGAAQATPAAAQNPAARSDAIPVKVAPVRRGSIASYLQGTATLESDETVQVLAEAAGRVTGLFVEEGDAVQRGQRLLQLDDREARLALERARVQLAEAKQAYTSLGPLDQQEAELTLRSAELEVESVRDHYRKTETMQRRGVISSQDLDSARTKKNIAELALQQARVRVQYKAIDDARFSYEQAQTALQEAQLRLQYTTVQAPLDGVVSQRLVGRGQFVTQHQHLFTVVDSSRLLAPTFVPEKFSGRTAVGQAAYLQVEAFPQQRFAARVRLISPVIEAKSGTFKVTVELTEPASALKPGMFASVFITVATRTATLVIPKRALALDSVQPTVYRLQNDRAYRAELTLGLADNERVEVLSGLAENEQIVVVGQEKLLDGTLVQAVADDT
ncbi:Multidrug resistance protein MdtA [Candidatus Entotheonellaceae bacterium PAL068K]